MIRLRILFCTVGVLACAITFADVTDDNEGEEPAGSESAVVETQQGETQQGETQQGETQQPALTLEDVHSLIKQLDANQFSDRTEASERLSTVGMIAVVPLADAVKTGSLEVQVRAIKLLDRLYRSMDEAVHEAAKRQLDALSQSDDEDTAGRAQAILDVPHYEIPPGMWLGQGQVNLFGGKRALQLGVGGGTVIRGDVVQIGVGSQILASRVQNGQRIVEIIQGSGLGVLMIEDEKEGRIEVHTCQQIAGAKPIFQRYQAKDADALKKQPKIFRLYDKYKGYRGGLVLGGGATSIE